MAKHVGARNKNRVLCTTERKRTTRIIDSWRVACGSPPLIAMRKIIVAMEMAPPPTQIRLSRIKAPGRVCKIAVRVRATGVKKATRTQKAVQKGFGAAHQSAIAKKL